MNPSRLFIDRPVATSLLTIGLMLAGMIGFLLLPVSPLPQVDFPTVMVQAALPGASPETMATAVAAPLERTLGRISGVSEITSTSSEGNTRVILQFDLDRNINGAVRDVQAAIQAARTLLPNNLPSNPTYRKVNPADAPVLLLALTSATLDRGQMYDVAATVLAQRLAQVEGIGQVVVGGAALPAVRIGLEPQRLASAGIALEDVRMAVAASQANRPKGAIEDDQRYWQIAANDQALTAADYAPLIIRFLLSAGRSNGAAVRLADVADIKDSVQDQRNYGVFNGRSAVLLILYRQPGSNIVQTVDRVRALLPMLKAAIPAAIDLNVAMDRTPTIRGSLREVERALSIAIGLVILVVFLFLRNGRAAAVPTVAIPVSLAGTCGVMYLAGYSLDNLSLMALTVATGFVVDDAIVVLENITRHLERGLSPYQGALLGAREIGFTVVAISLSLIAVFLPILLMGGVVGRLFREFAVVLSAAILVSMVVSLTTTPMMCAYWLAVPPDGAVPPDKTTDRQGFRARFLRFYRVTLMWALRHPLWILLLLVATVALNVYLYISIPKGFFPQQDTGRLVGTLQADQAASFAAVRQKVNHMMAIIKADPAIDTVTGFTGGGQSNTAVLFAALKPARERPPMSVVMQRLRGQLAHEPGASLFLTPVQDVRVGGRPSGAQFQYSLQAEDLDELRQWEPRIRRALAEMPQLVDVNTDQQERGLQMSLTIDRDTLARRGLSMKTTVATLNDAFAQRQIATLYHPLNQYRVVMELAPSYLQSPQTLKALNLITPDGRAVSLESVAHLEESFAPLGVNHQSGLPTSTISFNLPAGVSLGQASQAIDETLSQLGVPNSVRGGFQGTARVFQSSLASQPWLILAALVTIYLLLGILYESLIHPLTILSTLPSAGVGALLALQGFGIEFSVISLIGVFLLIGIVKKNAILMIDFAIDRQRRCGIGAGEAIYRACLVRVRPILMTTVAATLGAIPLAIGGGEGAEIRQPLGISIVGGLLLSQLLTLYTTPVVYVLMDTVFGSRPQSRKG